LLANNPGGISEVVNDKNESLTNFWLVLKHPEMFATFQRQIQATPFSEIVFNQSVIDESVYYDTDELVRWAVAFFIHCRQSLAGRMKGFASITRNRTRRGMNEQCSAWLNCIEGLSEVHGRLKRVAILNDDAIKVIKKEDGKRSLFYCDPPYYHSTRASIGEYKYEMSNAEHVELLTVLSRIEGKFILSGYWNEQYHEVANLMNWSRIDFDVLNNAAGGRNKRRMTECVWANFELLPKT
jgi:DNA adenine methylase